MGARLLGLLLVVREQIVQLLDQRPDLQRQRHVDPRRPARSHLGDREAHPPQWPQPVNRLER